MKSKYFKDFVDPDDVFLEMDADDRYRVAFRNISLEQLGTIGWAVDTLNLHTLDPKRKDLSVIVCVPESIYMD